LAKQASIEVLKRKHVLLLISDLDISEDEILILSHMTEKSRRPAEAQYEVIWLPILDRLTNEKNTAKFKHLQSMMPWYTVLDPWIIEPAVIKYINSSFIRSTGKGGLPKCTPHAVDLGEFGFPFQ